MKFSSASRRMNNVAAAVILAALSPASAWAADLVGSPATWEKNCGPGNVLPALTDAVRDQQPRMPYPAAKPAPSHGPNTFGDRRVNAERMFDHLTPPVRQALSALGVALMKSGEVPATLREIAIVRVGYAMPSLYEVHHHASFAHSLGVPDAKLAQLACRRPNGLDSVEQATVHFVDALVRSPRPSNAALAEIRRHLTDAQTLEVATIVGNWMMAGRLLGTTGTPIDDFAVGDQGVPQNFKR